MYNFTVRLAALPPPSAAERMWFASIPERPDQSALQREVAAPPMG
jgi:hypothetical protein